MPSPTAFRYAVIDLANAAPLRQVVPRLLSSAAVSLFGSTTAQQVQEVGPWLVQLAAAPQVDDMLARLPDGMAWGYYLHADVDILSLRQALRKFNLAKLEGSPRELLFRYWDPRVLRIFMDNANAVQRARFLEWVDRIEFADGQVVEKSAADWGRQ